jgi:methylated-DNA-[protein]-cysteine S-methyltransferase
VRKTPATGNSEAIISVFSTPLNWMGLLGLDGELISVFVGHSSAKSILAAAKRAENRLTEGDWNPELRSQLEAYANGQLVDFGSRQIRLPMMTSFRQKISDATRKLAYGQTTTYGELAQQAGHPRAARAVGTVMSSNRFPILIPCHRVLGSGGKLGGYTSPLGTDFKQRLLELEKQVVEAERFPGRLAIP